MVCYSGKEIETMREVRNKDDPHPQKLEKDGAKKEPAKDRASQGWWCKP